MNYCDAKEGGNECDKSSKAHNGLSHIENRIILEKAKGGGKK